MLTDSEKKDCRKRSGKRLFSALRKALLWLLLAAVVIYAASFLAAAPLARAHIAKLCDGAVYVQSGHLSGLSSITLKGLIIAADANSLTSAPILRCDKVRIDFNLNALLRGVFSINTIRLRDFLVSADYSNQEWNLASLSLHTGQTQSAPRLPFIELNRGALSVRTAQNGVFNSVAIMGFNGQLALGPDKRQYSFKLSSDGRFGFNGSQLEGVLTLAEGTAKHHLAASGTIQMPAAQVLGNSWNLRDVVFESFFDRDVFQISRLAFNMGQGSVKLNGSLEPGTLSMNVNLDAQNISISDKYAANTLVYSQPVLSLLDNGLSRFLKRFHPAGTGDAQLSFNGKLNDLSSAQLNGSLRSRSISVCDERFPFMLEDIEGEIAFSGRSLRFSDLQGNHKAASFLMSGNIENLGHKAAIDFQMVSQSVPLDEDLFNACSPQIKRIWYAFAPSGTIGIDYHFQSSSDRHQQLTMTLQFNGVDAVYQAFPYALDNLKGTVVVTPDEIRIKQLFSDQHTGGTVNINGLVEDLKSTTPYFQLDIQGRNIPIDQEFIKAIPPNRREFCNRIEIDAQADFDMDIPRQQFAGGIPQFNTDLQINGKKLLMKDFPLPMTDFQLVAHATADELTLHQFAAKAGGGSISGSGQLRARQADLAYNSVCLDINVDNVQFDDAFWQSLESKSSLGNFRLGGPLNAKGHIQRGLPADHCSNTQWSVECLGNTVLWADRPLGQARGKVTITKDAFVFDEFVLYVFQLEQLPEDLLNQVFPSLAKTELDGGACISLNHGTIRSQEAEAFSADLDGVLTLNAVSCGPLKQISDLTGTVRGRFKGVLGKEQIQIEELEADYELEHLSYQKCELTQLRGPIAFDRTANLLQSSGFTGASYGGNLNGSWSVDLHSLPPSYYVSGSFNSLDISRIISGPKKEEDIGGLASGSFELKGIAQAKDSPNGTLTLKVSDMRLGKQSLMGKLLTAIQLKQPREYIFNELQVDALVHARTLICKRVRIAGDPLIFYGSGMLDWERQQINLELVGIDRIFGNDDMIVNMLARGFGSAVWKIEVRGDLKEPAVDAVYLSVLKQPMEVFKSEGSI